MWMFCRSLFVLLSFFFWSLCCLFFHLRILITPLVSSKSSYSNMESTCVFRVSILSQFLRFASYILEFFWRRGFSCYFLFFYLFVCLFSFYCSMYGRCLFSYDTLAVYSRSMFWSYVLAPRVAVCFIYLCGY